MVIFLVPSNSVAVPVTAPPIAILRPVVSFAALATLFSESLVLSTLPRPISALVISAADEPS